jgi:oligopeptide/dipeptide ABC transporter ATP-binding protein
MPDPLLDAHGLSKTFVSGRGGSRREVAAVQDVSLRLDTGETHGLVGESGSGKSTTGRILLRLIERDAGSATFRGADLFALSGAELRRMRRHMQLIYQDPFSSVDPRFRARDIVAQPWAIHRMYDAPERRRRADALLERVGIDPALGDRRPASFSGGQLQRIGIARALALEPSLIVCDEPVSALDVSVQSQIINLLVELRDERDMSYLFIAHDLDVVRHISDRVSVMYAGRIVETGTRDEIFGRPSHPYTRALLAATGHRPAAATVSEPAVRTGLPSGCAFRDRCPIAQPRCAADVPRLIERGTGHPVACFFPPVESIESASDAGIDGDDGHVREQVDDGHEQARDDPDAHDERSVQAGQPEQ